MENREIQRSRDGIDRRGMLKCMAWVGTGLLWTVNGGIPAARVFGDQPNQAGRSSFSFVQISDSHIGFNSAPNHDVVGTLREVVARINAMPQRPAFVLHTGDLTHLARAKEFDTVTEVLKTVKAKVLYVPGEHDFDAGDNKLYLERFGKGTNGRGWYSFDHHGTHFVGLVNVVNSHSGNPNGLGQLGSEQLDWLTKDLRGLADSTPVVVFAHVPLWMVYEEWGWGTQDSARALALLKRFGSVTVLNGHIHQIMQKVEGNITFHTARSTAFPQGKPSDGKRGPIKNLSTNQLRQVLGLTGVAYVEGNRSLAIVDASLQS